MPGTGVNPCGKACDWPRLQQTAGAGRHAAAPQISPNGSALALPGRIHRDERCGGQRPHRRCSLRQARHPRPIAALNRVVRNQPGSPNANDIWQCEIFRRVLGINSARWTKAKMRKGAIERLQQCAPADGFRWEELLHRKSFIECAHGFGGSTHTGKKRQVRASRRRGNFRRQAWADTELGSCINGLFPLRPVKDCACTHDCIGNRIAYEADGRKGG